MDNQRLFSLDVFRGLIIAFMILVNNPGTWASIYYPLRHAEWHGCTPTDLVFPFFLFIVGVSMYLSFTKYNQELNQTVLLKILKRTGLIFLIGVSLNWFPFYHLPISEVRIMGVLQRIALAYGIGAILCLIIPSQKLIFLAFGILLFYWALLGFSVAEHPYELETNFIRQIDLAVFGENHIWNGLGVPFDPEGLISTIPAIVSVIFGYVVGGRVHHAPNKHILVKELLFYGFVLLFIGWFWDKFFPINKSIWSSSYVLYTTGMAMVGFGMLIELLDIQGQKWFAKPFLVFGTNSLFAYIFSGVLFRILFYFISWENENGVIVHAPNWLYTTIFEPTFGSLNGSLMYAVTFVAICWAVTGILYRNKFFIKL